MMRVVFGQPDLMVERTLMHRSSLAARYSIGWSGIDRVGLVAVAAHQESRQRANLSGAAPVPHFVVHRSGGKVWFGRMLASSMMPLGRVRCKRTATLHFVPLSHSAALTAIVGHG